MSEIFAKALSPLYVFYSNLHYVCQKSVNHVFMKHVSTYQQSNSCDNEIDPLIEDKIIQTKHKNIV